ncbi:MAG: recombinase RecA [Candidatus Omnitrophica bacterium]|nr:recombinase RecA [Candidatus Omnitrophota bacterium]
MGKGRRTSGKKSPEKQDLSAEGKKRSLELALEQIEKQFGQGSIMTLGQDRLSNIETISTGSVALDVALGGGGVPRGRIVEIYGPEGSGKTTLTLSVIAQAQKKKGVAAFIDAEHGLDPFYAKKLGVNLDELLISQPDTGEQALEIAEMLIRSNSVDVLVIDSVAALVPRAEIEGEMGDQFIGLQARLMSQALRKLTAAVSKSKTCLIFINQLRMKIGVMFGNPETTPGGRALKFFSSVRIDVRRIATIKKGDKVIGTRAVAKVVKNKIAPPFRQAEFDIMHDEGISVVGSIVDMGEITGLIKKSGSWLIYGDTKLGQGKEQAKGYLKENPDLLDELTNKIREHAAAEL